MVQSIVSTFFGVCFPHTIVCDEDNDEVFINLYEASSAYSISCISFFFFLVVFFSCFLTFLQHSKFSVKVITTIALLKNVVEDYLPESDIENFIELKEPVMMVVNGQMEQQAIGTSFLGIVFEEKFHVKCLSAFILPCVPLIPEHMKTMAHPDISPNQFEEGIKNGYYMVNLSVNQTFGPAEFHAADGKVGIVVN